MSSGIELEDTIGGMTSSDYKERFIAEYEQLCIRRRRLVNILARWYDPSLDFNPKCPYGLLREQADLMAMLTQVMERRARYGGIDLRPSWKALYDGIDGVDQSGCGGASASYAAPPGGAFTFDHVSRDTYVMTDSATGVEYVVLSKGPGLAITPRLNADGSVMVGDGE